MPMPDEQQHDEHCLHREADGVVARVWRVTPYAVVYMTPKGTGICIHKVAYRFPGTGTLPKPLNEKEPR